MTIHRIALAVAAAAGFSCAASPRCHAAFTLADIQFWTGAPAGPGVNEAALVIDFAHAGADAAPSLAWGYRWPSAESRNGQDMVAAVVAADPRLYVTGLEFGFVDTVSFDSNLDGAVDLRHPGFDPVTGRYSVYWVNNAVIPGTPPLFSDAGHVLPPNGPPYATDSPGAWVVSTTGLFARPLANGSWDGWIYASDPAPSPREPVAASVPETSALSLVLAAAGSLARRRRTVSPTRRTS